MSKKLILFLMVLLFGSTSFLRADELTIHDGTATNAYVPVYGFYADAYLKSEMVFPASELTAMNGGTINGITFYATTPASEAWGSTFQVFMKEVAETSISEFAGTDGATIVYEGTLDGTASTMEITFSTPYNYAGGNLLVGVYNTTKGTYKSITWGGESVDGASVQGYSYSDLTSVSPTQRNFLPKTTFAFTAGSGPVPPTPTGQLVVTPNTFDLGARPNNGWMESMPVRIQNGGAPVTITAIMSNTSGNEAIVMDPEQIVDLVLDTDEEFAFTVTTNMVDAGEYAEEFSMFVVNNDRDITVIPATATIYEAGEADIVETAKTLAFSYTAGVAEFNHTPVDIHPNYFGSQGMIANDAVYQFNLAKDAKFSVNAGAGSYIGIYNKVLNFHPTMAVEPVAYAIGEMQDEILLAGQYYMIVAGDNFTSIEGTVEQLPAPTALVALAPEDGATEVEAPVTLTWEGGENAAEYQVLFGTSPVHMDVVLDWTVIDDNFGSYTVTSLQPNTQYFWQIKARNTNGNVATVRRGFTSSLTKPNTVTASAQQIFTDEGTLIKWKHSSGAMGDLPETQIGSGSSTSSYLPTYNLYNYSLAEQIYTSEELGGEAGYINSISFHPVGAITRNLKIYMANTDKETFTGASDWVAMTEDNLVYEGDVAMVANQWVTVNFADPFEYEGGNIILAVTDHTGTWTSSISYSTFDATAQAINVYQDSAPYSAIAPSGSGTVRDFKNQIIINKEDAKGVAANRTFMYYNVYYGDVKANTEPIYEKQYWLENLPYKMDEGGHAVTVTAVYEEGESQKSAPVFVQVSGYGKFQGDVTALVTEVGGGQPVAGVNVKFNGQDEFNNNVMFEGTTDGQGHYIINNVKAGSYTGVASLDGMEPAYATEETAENQDLEYDQTNTVDFIIHEEYKPVMSVFAEEVDPSMSRVKWSINEMISGGGSGSGSASTFSEGFESGMPEGWTVVDANNDGYTWCLTSAIPTTWTYYASMTLDWYRSGSNAICSGSYINGAGALNPDEYLVMGQQNIANGSTLSFWAAATDASYPADHFGVAVSDDATTWTMVQEWTLTGKKGANGGRESRDGNGAKLGTWHSYSVDLSAYAGQKYIAIRHFNCYDQYIMCVDDIELTTGRNRDVKNYAVYRKAILKETELTDEDFADFGTTTDTLYADFDWNNCAPGLYQYGVSAIYPTPVTDRANRDEIVIGDPTSTTTNSYLPTYSLYEYSLTEQIYTADEIGMAGTINTLTMWLKNNSSYARNINVYMKEADVVTFADGNAWVSMEDSDMVASFTLANGISSPVETAIALNTPFNYSGNGNLVICFQDVTGSWSSGAASVVMTGNGNQAIYAYRDGTVYNPTTPGVTGYVTTNKSVIMLDITPGGGSGNDNPVTDTVWSNILPKDMKTVVTINANVATGSVEGATIRFNNTFEDLTFMETFDETGTIVIEDFEKGFYTIVADLEGYYPVYPEQNSVYSIWNETTLNITFEEVLKPVDAITVSGTGFARWTEVVPVDRIAEKYFVTLNGVFYAETEDNFLQFDFDVLEEGLQYTVGVAVVYSTGMSQYVTTQFTYIGCEAVTPQVEGLEATNEAGDHNIILTWNGGTPNPNPNPNPGPQGGWTEGFESGMPAGWTTLDGNGDGYTWCLTSAIPSTWTYYSSISLDWYRTGSNAICSGSFINGVGAITPNDFLVTAQVTPSAGSTFSFYAAACDASYPAEHFGVAVSTTGTAASNFAMVQEWTLSAKEGAAQGGRESRDGDGAKLGSWHQYSVDLSAYAGQNIYIAIRHFECNDQYIMCVDDIAFTADAKLGGTLAEAGKGFGAAANELRDGNWYYYDNGVNEDAIGTGGGNFWWGIMLPAGSYEGEKVTKVAAYDYMAMTGTVSIYQGGTSSPAGSALGQTNVTFTGSNDFVEFTFAEPVEIDPEQNVWVIFYNGSGATYPAAVCANTGNANGRWVSLDGSTWEDLAGYGLDYTFMVRAYIEQGGGTPSTTIVPNKYNIIVDGNFVGATSGTDYTYEVSDWAEHEYAVIWVSSTYEMSCLIEGQNLIYYGGNDNVEENSVIDAIYPNPTNSNLYIQASAMKHISVYNAMGQMVCDVDVNADQYVLDMAQYEDGVYMVNVITENGSSVKRVTVAK